MTVKQFLLKKFPTNKWIDCPIPKHHWETIQEYADAYHEWRVKKNSSDAGIEEFAVLIPITNQIDYNTFKDSYKTLIVSKKLNLDEIMIEVRKVKKDAKIETLHFTEIIEAKTKLK